jgi:hypothetical protein
MPPSQNNPDRIKLLRSAAEYRRHLAVELYEPRLLIIADELDAKADKLAGSDDQNSK